MSKRNLLLLYSLILLIETLLIAFISAVFIGLLAIESEHTAINVYYPLLMFGGMLAMSAYMTAVIKILFELWSVVLLSIYKARSTVFVSKSNIIWSRYIIAVLSLIIIMAGLASDGTDLAVLVIICAIVHISSVAIMFKLIESRLDRLLLWVNNGNIVKDNKGYQRAERSILRH